MKCFKICGYCFVGIICFFFNGICLIGCSLGYFGDLCDKGNYCFIIWIMIFVFVCLDKGIYRKVWFV